MISIEFSDTILNISDEVVMQFTSISELGFKAESGGILLGKKSINSQEYYLDKVSLPSSKDRQGAFFFVRNARSANAKIKQEWQQSIGIVNYMGEWHTHNEPRPHPSGTDKGLMKQVVLDKSCPFDRVFMIILGNDHHMFCGVVNPDQSPLFYDTKMIGWKE